MASTRRRNTHVNKRKRRAGISRGYGEVMVSSLPAYMQVVQQDVDEELELDQGGIRAPVRVGLAAAFFDKRSLPGSIGP